MIKSFRGKLADGDQETIRLSTNNGLTGYRVVKFQLIGDQPATTSQEATCKLYSYKQTTIDSAIDFSDSTLLAVGLWSSNTVTQDNPEDLNVIFEGRIFNQDIFITNKGSAGTSVNYYLELEQVKLDLGEATVATLKDMRGSN